MQRGRPKKQHGYLRTAARQFLDGTRCRTPEEAVLKSLRSLEEWADALRGAKEAQTSQCNQTGLRISPSSSATIPSSHKGAP